MFVIVRSPGGDWEALYKNGKMIAQDHSISLDKFVDLTKGEIDFKGLNFPDQIEENYEKISEYMEDRRDLPFELSELNLSI